MTVAVMLRTEQVARRLGVHVATVRAEIHRGNLPARMIARRLMVDEADLAAYLSARVV